MSKYILLIIISIFSFVFTEKRPKFLIFLPEKFLNLCEKSIYPPSYVRQSGSPLYRENEPKISLSGGLKGLPRHRNNTGFRFFAQVVNSLTLKDIAKFAIFLKLVSHIRMSLISEIPLYVRKSGSPLYRENGPKISLSGGLKGLPRHRNNTGFRFFAQVVNSLTLKDRPIAKFAIFLKLVSHIRMSLISEIGTGKMSSWTEKKQGKHKEFENGDPGKYNVGLIQATIDTQAVGDHRVFSDLLRPCPLFPTQVLVWHY